MFNIPSYVQYTQVEVKRQISQLQNEMTEVKTLLASLTQQVIPQLEEGNARRASTSRPL